MHVLRENIIQTIGENPPYLDQVLSHFKSTTLKRNNHLIKEGDICRNIYFVKKGLLQVCKSDADSNEMTIDLITENNWFTDIESFKNEVSSHLNVKATKATEVYTLNKQSFEMLMSKVPKFAEAYMKIIESKYKESIERITAFSALGANHKIQWLRCFRPELFKRAPDKLIAEYLGISKETFCRQK
jgi:CRP-like cAMP-binding protein